MWIVIYRPFFDELGFRCFRDHDKAVAFCLNRSKLHYQYNMFWKDFDD